jgi:predicted ATPase
MLTGAGTRLVTLTGPPGIGKTRLAVACAAAYAERTGCAAEFVDLAPLRDPAMVIVELARALDVEPRSGTDLVGQLAAAVGNEARLVVLDNYEHLLAAAPDLGQVLASCQRLLVLVIAGSGCGFRPSRSSRCRRLRCQLRRMRRTLTPWARIRRSHCW